MNRSEAGKLGWAKSKVWMLAHTVQKKNDARMRYAAAPRKCRRCESLIPYEQRDNSFCTASCAAFWNNAQRVQQSRSCEGCRRRGRGNKRRWFLITLTEILTTGLFLIFV